MFASYVVQLGNLLSFYKGHSLESLLWCAGCRCWRISQCSRQFTALRLCWCAPTCPFVMVVLAVTEASSLRDVPLLKGADSLLYQLSVCLCGSTPHFTRHFSMGPRVWTCWSNVTCLVESVKVVKLSALRSGRLYLAENISGTHFC